MMTKNAVKATDKPMTFKPTAIWKRLRTLKKLRKSVFIIFLFQLFFTLSTGFAFAACQLWKNTAKKEIRRQNNPAAIKINGVSAIRYE